MATPETVKFYLIDQDDDPIVGVLIRIYDAAGAVFKTQQVTSTVGPDAVAEVTLDGDTTPISYTIRLYKTGVAFDGSLGDTSKTPQLISVYSPASGAPNHTNNFEIKGETFVRPVATDPRLCRLSGWFKDISGRPLYGLEMKFINEFAPALVDGYAVMGEGLEISTDPNGYAVIDLYRNGKYEVWVEGVQAPDSDDTQAIGFPRYISVPDQGSANMPDLLFPIVSEIVFDPSSLAISVEEIATITPTVYGSDGRTLIGPAVEDVIYASSDTSIITVGTTETAIAVYGVAAGTAYLTAVRKDQTIVKIPDTGIIGQPVTVVVS